MSAKKERELRRQLAACEALLGQHEGMMELHRLAEEKLDRHQKCLEINLDLHEALQRRLLFLERDVKRNTEWRRECIERRMERAVQIRKVREAFCCMGLFFGFLFLGAAGGLTLDMLQLVPGVMLMVGFGVLSGICFCKGGVFDG